MNDSTTITLLMISAGSWLFCFRSKLKWVHLLGLSLLISLVVNIVAIELRNSGQFNAHIINAFVAIEYFLVGTALVTISDFKKVVTLVVLVGGVLVLGFLLRDLFTGAFFNWPSTSAIIVAGLFLAVLAMIGLYGLAYTSDEPLKGQPVFWLYNIVLLYYLCQAPIFGLMSKFDQQTASAIYDLYIYLFCFHELALASLFLFTSYKTRQLKHASRQ
jgi:hypothetical protein